MRGTGERKVKSGERWQNKVGEVGEQGHIKGSW